MPVSRWGNPDFYYHPDPKIPDKTYTKIGGFLAEFKFDPLRYRIPPSVAQKMDRTQQLAVTCVGEALEDAGLSAEELKGKRVGIIIGNSMGGETTDLYAERMTVPRTIACLEEAFSSLNVDSETRKKLIEEFRSRYLNNLPDITEDSLPGELANVISGRVANVFNLEGPNFTVDAACASSMAAVMNAVAALRGGSIDYAVTGGVDAQMNPASFVKFCKIGALSPDGSRPFDEGANGFVMGEGAGMMILKRLSDAVRDGDRIYGTIVETGSSSDGRGKGITAPNAAGQERAIRACFDAAGINPRVSRSCRGARHLYSGWGRDRVGCFGQVFQGRGKSHGLHKFGIGEIPDRASQSRIRRGGNNKDASWSVPSDSAPDGKRPEAEPMY